MKPWGVLRPEGDRVVILEDTNADGVADKEKTFFQSKDLTNPLGICVLPNPSGKGSHVLVSASPNLWLLTDADGELQETLHWLDTAKACSYILAKDFDALDAAAQSVGKQLGSMINQHESFCFQQRSDAGNSRNTERLSHRIAAP
jgi:hypothetical protein